MAATIDVGGPGPTGGDQGPALLQVLAGFGPYGTEREKGYAIMVTQLGVFFVREGSGARGALNAALGTFYDPASVRGVSFMTDFHYGVRAVRAAATKATE